MKEYMETNAPISSVVPNTETVQKRIRTFAGDMKVMKDGGMPDLTPFVSSRLNASTVSKEPSMIPSIAAPVSSKVSEVLPQEPRQNVSVQNPVVQNTASIEQKSSFIETYAGDFADKVKTEHASVATVLAAEQDSLSSPSEAPPEKSSGANYLYIVAGILLLVVGGATAYIAYTRYLTSTLPVVITPTVSAPLFVDEREQVSGNDSELERSIVQSVGRPIAVGNVRLLYDDLSTESIFSRLPFVPNVLARNIRTEGSVAGVVHIGGVQSPFFVLSVTSYGNSFSGMLLWETVMPHTLDGLFPPYPSAQSLATATSSAQAATTTASVSSGFRDEVVSNHDVRVYRDAAGRSVMLYGYWDRSTLIIARDPKAFGEILQRIAHSRAP